MRVAYLTTDAVNEHFAKEMAAESGMTLIPLSLRDCLPGPDFDAVLYDWDHLPASQQDSVLTQILATPAARPVVVHGYGLEEDLTQALRHNAVAVYRCLQPEAFQLLQLTLDL